MIKIIKTCFQSIKGKLTVKINYDSNFVPYQRIVFLSILIFFSITAILLRLTYVTVWPSNLNKKLKTQAHKQTETEILIAPPRGTISDRKGRVLAASLIKPSIFIIPKRIPKSIKEKQKIAKALNTSLEKINIISKKNTNFHWIHRLLEKDELDKFGDISQWRDFIGWAEESKRYYPEGHLASHILGFVGVDGDGLAGIEYTQNKILKSKEKKKKVTRDARGKITLINPGVALQPEPEPESIQLAIDVVIQKVAENSIKNAVLKSKSTSGSVVVAHVSSGEVLGLASYPNFHPSNGTKENEARLRFNAISDGLEVGSILKPFIIGYALENKLINFNEQFFCENGKLSLPGGYIHDTQPKNWLKPIEILKYSSNICMYKITKKMGRPSLFEAYRKTGLIGSTGIEINGEWQGHLSPPDSWKEMRFANLAFGQGVAVSNIQVARALVKLLSGGNTDQLTVLKNKSRSLTPGHNKINFTKKESIDYIKKAMSLVTSQEGTGHLGRVNGLKVGGKTGTAQKYNALTKSYSDRVSSFIGFAPFENPSIVVTVILDSPAVRPAYGGLLAAPVFSQVVDQSMKYLLSSSDLYVKLDRSLNEP